MGFHHGEHGAETWLWGDGTWLWGSTMENGVMGRGYGRGWDVDTGFHHQERENGT